MRLQSPCEETYALFARRLGTDSGKPDDETTRDIEGWILGRQSQPVAEVPKHYSANTDPGLTDWLHWASESGEVPMFIRTIAEAAAIADLPQYALLRPVLFDLMRQSPQPFAHSYDGE